MGSPAMELVYEEIMGIPIIGDNYSFMQVFEISIITMILVMFSGLDLPGKLLI